MAELQSYYRTNDAGGVDTVVTKSRYDEFRILMAEVDFFSPHSDHAGEMKLRTVYVEEGTGLMVFDLAAYEHHKWGD